MFTTSVLLLGDCPHTVAEVAAATLPPGHSFTLPGALFTRHSFSRASGANVTLLNVHELRHNAVQSPADAADAITLVAQTCDSALVVVDLVAAEKDPSVQPWRDVIVGAIPAAGTEDRPRVCLLVRLADTLEIMAGSSPPRARLAQCEKITESLVPDRVFYLDDADNLYTQVSAFLGLSQ